MAKKTTDKSKTIQKTRLQNELIKLIKTIDEQGLLHLIQQANILRYNMQVDKINKEKDKIINRGLKVPKKSNKKK